ncbi:MAG: metal-dependent hydrolase [Peptococcales bacterium]|jgi:inner membrane protein
MDPITHALIGTAVAVVGGADVSLVNPQLIASILGAVSPDLDIICQYWGHRVYLQHHRGFSHSMPGLISISLLIGGFLSFFHPTTGLEVLFFWTFLGALSHTFLDLLNSYGVMLLYPFSKKKYTLNLLMITDPFLIIGSIIMIFCGYYNLVYLYFALIVTVGYLVLRLFMRRRAEKIIRKHFDSYLDKLVVMPAFIGLVKWDFIARVQKKNIVGQINLFTKKITIHKKLKLIAEEIKEKLEGTKIGVLFKEFTPFFHIDYYIEGNKLIARFIDLRYFVKNRFLHHGTLIVDKNNYQVEQELFQPYSPKNSIEIK